MQQDPRATWMGGGAGRGGDWLRHSVPVSILGPNLKDQDDMISCLFLLRGFSHL